MNETNRENFKLPEGYRTWCWICADPPFNKVTNVDGKNIPGQGFRSIEEHAKHTKDMHRVWKG
jgi:hypothetical protein